ncbi:MAG: GlsB/YeaQ/YmgE family stress response membrane protein [Muribaculaceae bacterium]|nr:GlsB/YeaQ/YmgE family stress response membrane protein [Muribaculaceae bacterium]MDE6331407.1 GlsB/YeaQ/YmgE family stress response membrane protein [Muribaculaceae bacterium]
MGDINVWAWVAWVIVGLAVGLMAGRALGGRRILAVDLLVGLVGACLGGWGCDLALGDDTPQLFIISVLVALFVSGCLIWLFDAVWQLFNHD